MIPKEKQREQFRKYAGKSVNVLYVMLGKPDVQEKIIELAERRAFGIGFEQYGDTSFLLTDPDLVNEIYAELADATFYQSVRLASVEKEFIQYRNRIIRSPLT